MSKNKKILVSLDLNCLIGYVAPIKNFKKENALFPDYAPNKVVNGSNIWIRPNLDILLQSLFYEKKNIFDVGVWASQTKENTAFQIQQFLGSLQYNLKFALFTKPPSTHDSLLPLPNKRDLKVIFSKFPEYSEKNTIVLTNFKNEVSEYRENEVILPLYHPELGTTQFNLDAHMYYIHEYLILMQANHTINKGEDIRDTLKQVSYEQMVRLRSGSNRPDKGKWDVSGHVRF